ncbi:expressed unknown protein [Seminavis robusta]|uniref:Uncharacterized protein n=1 Tax=Seminavis robusta TaxID=568900 RepID=A0A9N8HUZ6_9STRA|nr:expressed unknown protein [Seminavis robusta]|eukprot:Sro2200_g318860.1 n/a (171) ;mRNA; f:16180-16845
MFHDEELPLLEQQYDPEESSGLHAFVATATNRAFVSFICQDHGFLTLFEAEARVRNLIALAQLDGVASQQQQQDGEESTWQSSSTMTQCITGTLRGALAGAFAGTIIGAAGAMLLADRLIGVMAGEAIEEFSTTRSVAEETPTFVAQVAHVGAAFGGVGGALIGWTTAGL